MSVRDASFASRGHSSTTHPSALPRSTSSWPSASGVRVCTVLSAFSNPLTSSRIQTTRTTAPRRSPVEPNTPLSPRSPVTQSRLRSSILAHHIHSLSLSARTNKVLVILPAEVAALSSLLFLAMQFLWPLLPRTLPLARREAQPFAINDPSTRQSLIEFTVVASTHAKPG